MSSRIKNSLLNVTSLIIMNVLSMLIGFVRMRLIINNYGDAFNGLYQFASQFIEYVSIVNIGYTSLYIVSLFKALKENDQLRINKLLNGCVYYQNKVIKAMFLIMLGVIGVVALFVNDPDFSKMQIIFTIIVLIIPIFAEQFLDPKLVLYDAMQLQYKMKTPYYIVRTLSRIITCVSIFFVDMYMFLVLETLVSTIVIAYFYIKANKITSEYTKYTKDIDSTPAKYTTNYFAVKVSSLIINSTDNLVIGKILGLVSVGVVSPYIYIVNSLSYLQSNFLAGIKSSMGDFLLETNIDKKERINEVSLITFYISMLLYGLCFIGIDSFVRIFFYNNESYNTVKFLSELVCLLFFIKNTYSYMLMIIEVKGEFKRLSIEYVLEAIVNIIISVILVYKLGIIGAYIGTIVSYLFIQIPICIYYLKDENKYSYFIQLFIAYLKILVFILVSYLLKLLLANVIINNVIIWIIYMAIIGIIYLVLLTCVMYLFSDFRKMIKIVLAQAFKGVR